MKVHANTNATMPAVGWLEITEKENTEDSSFTISWFTQLYVFLFFLALLMVTVGKPQIPTMSPS